MRLAINFNFWYAATWGFVLLLYTMGLSQLNAPLDGELATFIFVTVACSAVLAVLHSFRPPSARTSPDQTVQPARSRTGEKRRLGGWLTTILIVVIFVVDFAYQRKIPLLAGGYDGYDVTQDIQATVGIPVLHVFVIAFAIFYALTRADSFFSHPTRAFALQFFVLLLMLLLNNSRGYMVFCLAGALIMAIAYRSGLKKPRRILIVTAALLGAYIIAVGIGVLGNIRTGLSWNDSSYITRIGLYQGSFPNFLGDEVKWLYTYATSPLANLNFNISTFTASGNLSHSLWAFVPDSFGKYEVAKSLNVAYQVTYLNASTGFIVAYGLGGGVGAMYLSYFIQILLLEIGGWIARLLGTVEVLYGACASLMLIIFVFFNTFSNTATCFMIPLCLATGVLRRRTIRRRAMANTRLENLSSSSFGKISSDRVFG